MRGAKAGVPPLAIHTDFLNVGQDCVFLNYQDYELEKNSCDTVGRQCPACYLCLFLHSSAQYYARALLSCVYFKVFHFLNVYHPHYLHTV